MKRFAALSLCIMFASQAVGADKKKAGAKSNPPKNAPIKSESSKQDKPEVELEGSDVRGIKMSPLNSLVNEKAKPDFDFVKIRTDWKAEMLDSTRSLETSGKKLEYTP